MHFREVKALQTLTPGVTSDGLATAAMFLMVMIRDGHGAESQ